MPDGALRTAARLLESPRRAMRGAGSLRRVSLTRHPIGCTPRERVWSLNKATLYRYRPPSARRECQEIPILLVYALINTPAILDLRPGGSFVEYLLDEGHDVFLLDWGAPGPEDAGDGLDHYVLDLLPRALRALRRATGEPRFDLLGWCIGAIISLAYAALRPDDGLRNLVLLTAPLDHSRRSAPGISRWVAPDAFDLDLLLARTGNMPGELLDLAARNLRPVENHLAGPLRLLDLAEDDRRLDAWHAMATWLRDTPDVPGAFYRELIRDIYNDNRLINGTLALRGEAVDLGRVRAPVLNVLADADHLVPAHQSETLPAHLHATEVDQIRVPGGHIGMMAGRRARAETWPAIETWLSEHA